LVTGTRSTVVPSGSAPAGTETLAPELSYDALTVSGEPAETTPDVTAPKSPPVTRGGSVPGVVALGAVVVVVDGTTVVVTVVEDEEIVDVVEDAVVVVVVVLGTFTTAVAEGSPVPWLLTASTWNS
jgi:hypothetical protein